MNGIRNYQKLGRRGLAIVSLLAAIGARPARSQDGIFPADKPPMPGSLKHVPVPLPPNLSEFVANKAAAIVLGKAFFWDAQVGSDGLACASCHFNAGADNRFRNSISSGLRNETNSAVNLTFNQTASNRGTSLVPPNGGGGPNYTLKKADFPFHQLLDPLDRNSQVLFDTDDVVSSQGVFHRDMLAT